MPTYGEELLANGWRGGGVLPLELYEIVRPHLRHGEELPPTRLDPNDWLIVVSQTCDVVAISNNAEPHLELLLAHILPGQPRTQFRNSTRQIDFRPNRINHPATVLTAHATADRFFVPRRLLVSTVPDAKRVLSAAATKKLQDWLALRAARPAWPNEFVVRIKAVERDLEAALEPLADEIAQVRVGISPNDSELNAEQPYRVAAYFVVSDEDFKKPEVRRAVQQSFNQFISALSRCDGIAVNKDLSNVVSGDDFTWAENSSTDLWNFAYLSQDE